MNHSELEAQRDGQEDGRAWARARASYVELGNLERTWASTNSCETIDALGPPGVFLTMIWKDNFTGRDDIEGFWMNLGGDPYRDENLYSSDYWDAFAEGALEVFEDVREKL